MIETGTLLQDRFLIEEPIGRGGMGAVYIATDQKFGSRVAIKERSYEDPELARAFEREARLLNGLHHPILPHVSDYFDEGGRYFLVMEYIDGEDLSAVLARDGAFPVDQVVRWTLELLDGLDYLHSQDPPVIHRDIKPGNLKLTPRGNVVLLDFGLAKESESNTLTARSVFGYSRRYSSLEQIEGTGTDVRSDLFSLGATLFHLLTGRPPVDALARASAIVAGRPDPLPLASEVNEQIPEPLARVINSALALNAEHRFISANAMRTALDYAVGNIAVTNPEVEDEAATAGGVLAAASPPTPVVAHVSKPPQNSLPKGSKGPKPLTAGLGPAAAALRNRVRVRFIRPFWQKPATWAAALGCLLLFAYLIYRSDSHDEQGKAPVEQSSTPTPIVSEQKMESLSEPTPEPESVLQDPSYFNAENTEVPTVEESKKKDSVESEKPKRADRKTNKAEIEPVADKIEAKSSAKNVDQGAATSEPSRPRVIRQVPARPRVQYHDPVYSIETIITGAPPSGGGGWRPRRYLSEWERDQLRRQRFQEMIRDTRTWRPPL